MSIHTLPCMVVYQGKAYPSFLFSTGPVSADDALKEGLPYIRFPDMDRMYEYHRPMSQLAANQPDPEAAFRAVLNVCRSDTEGSGNLGSRTGAFVASWITQDDSGPSDINPWNI